MAFEGITGISGGPGEIPPGNRIAAEKPVSFMVGAFCDICPVSWQRILGTKADKG